MSKSKFFSSILALIAMLGVQSEASEIADDYQFRSGDVLIKKAEQWKAIKILHIDTFENDDETLHILVYEDTLLKPTLNELKRTSVQIKHSPITRNSFEKDWQVLGNEKVNDREIEGFINYLKHNDFQRYAEFTNQDLNNLISLANSKYKKAYSLSKESKLKEAIELYSEAVEIFPLFIEAIDNIAFIYMDMGQYELAIEYFNKSLMIEPRGYTALYYKGKSFINLGDVDTALTIFKEGMISFPEKEKAFEEMYLKLKKIKDMRNNG